MATSSTDLVNAGLVMLGEKPLASLDDESDVALAARTLYDNARDFVLALHPWNRCVKHVALSKLATTPAMTWDFAYLYPSDALRILAPDAEWEGWEIGHSGGQNVIWSNQDGVVVRYIFRNDDVSKYSPWLCWVISAWMAAVLAQALTQHRGKVQDRMGFYERMLSQAKAMDGQEQSPAEFRATTLTDDVRVGG